MEDAFSEQDEKKALKYIRYGAMAGTLTTIPLFKVAVSVFLGQFETYSSFDLAEVLGFSLVVGGLLLFACILVYQNWYLYRYKNWVSGTIVLIYYIALKAVQWWPNEGLDIMALGVNFIISSILATLIFFGVVNCRKYKKIHSSRQKIVHTFD